MIPLRPFPDEFPEDGDFRFEGSGAFDQLVWRTQGGGDATAEERQMVTLHEWAHHELNNVTTYGAVLTMVAQLARHGLSGRERYRSLLLGLAGRSREAHEVYATWFSVDAFGIKVPVAELVGSHPPEYQRYHRSGAELVKGIESPFLRQQAFLCQMRLCFESAAIAEAAADLEHFTLAEVRAREFPSERLKMLPRLVPPGYFEAELAAFLQAQAGTSVATLIQWQVGMAEREVLDADSANAADAATSEFHRWLHMRLAERFAAAGLPCCPFHHHLSYFREQAPKVEALCESGDHIHKLVPNADPLDNATNLLMQMENEVLQVRPEPLPTRWVWCTEIAAEDRAALVSGPSPGHLFVAVRFASQLVEQHAFSFEQREALLREEGPLTFIRVRRTTAAGPECLLCLFHSPEEFIAFRQAMALPACASLSMTALGRSPWADAWLDHAFDGVFSTVSFDRSLYLTLKESWPLFQSVRYDKGVLHAGESRWVFLAFLCGSADGTFSLFIAPCSEMCVNAVHAFIRHRLDGEKFRHDPEFLVELQRESILNLIVSHLFAEEHYFSFNALRYAC